MKENKMKPKRVQRLRGNSCFYGKGAGGDGSTRTQSTSSSSRLKPFTGKVFYLDLPSNRTTETLERDIKDLGGTVEKFFSKEIKYLVSNKREARYVRCLRPDSPVPSPDSGQSSPRPGPHRPGGHEDKTGTRAQTETVVSSRGKSLVERVVKEQERIQINKILSNALEWGVKILYVDDVMTFVQKRKKLLSQSPAAKTTVKTEAAAKQSVHRCKAGRISKPFIKVEDSSRHYRPIYLSMSNVPEFNLKAAAPVSPFCVDDKDPPVNKQHGRSEDKPLGRKKNRDKKRGGYCECCLMKYENLKAHLQSERHKTFSKSDEYLVVDEQVSSLSCNFIHVNGNRVRRPKCSVSSVLVAPGPFKKPDLRPEDKVVKMETVNEEQQRQTEDVEPGPGPGPGPGHRHRRSRYNSDRFKHKPAARKRPTRLNSTKDPGPEEEPAPGSSGSSPERLSSTSRLNGPDEQTFNDDVKSSASVREQNESSPETNRQDNSTTLPPHSFSPARQIHRKVRLYKRKRRKVDADVERDVRTRDGAKTLWDLFLSSDDVDAQFHGFD